MLLNVEQRLVESGNFIGTSLLHLTSGLTESEQSVCLCVFVCVCLTQYEAAFFTKLGERITEKTSDFQRCLLKLEILYSDLKM